MEEGHYRCSVGLIKRSEGRSAVAAAAYRSGSRLHEEGGQTVHDYSRRKGVLHSEIITPEKAPAWMQERGILWNRVEAQEKRKDAQLAREVVVSLPHQLDDESRLKLTRAFVQDNFISRGMVADVAIHAPPDDGDRRNHHAHILLTLRQVEGDGFRRTKTREWNSDDFLRGVRASWAEHVNRAYESHGLAVAVDHRSYKDRGDERTPTVHLGKTRANLARQGRPLPERRRVLSERARTYWQTLKEASPDKQKWMRHPRSPWAKARREFQYQRKARSFHVDRAMHNWVVLRNRAFYGDEKTKANLAQWHELNNERQTAERQLWGLRKRRQELFHDLFKDGDMAMRRFALIAAEVGHEKALVRLQRSPLKFGTPARGGRFIFTGRLPGLDALARSLANPEREELLTGRVQTLGEAVEKIRRSLTFQEWKARDELTRSHTYEVNYLGLLTSSIENTRNHAVQRELERLKETGERRQILENVRRQRQQLEQRRAERLAEHGRGLIRTRENW